MEYIDTLIAITAITIILYYIIKYLINKFFEFNMVKGFSGPKAFPLIGNIYLLLGDMEDVTNKMLKLSTKYTSPWRFWIGPKLFILFDDPKCIEIITKRSNSYEKNLIYEFFKPVLGNGLFTVPASNWEIHRKILSPVFKEKFHSTYIDSILKNSNRLVTILENTNGENVDIMHYIHLCTLDIIYGRDLDLQNNPECKLDEYMSEIMDIGIQRIVKFWLHPNIIFNNSSTGKRLQKLLSHFNKITKEIMREKKESMQKDKITPELEVSDERINTSTFLDLLLKSFYETGVYSEQDIHDEINTLVFSGSETTTGTLAFLFLMLATFPEVQQRVYEELYQMYGSSDHQNVPITLQDIKKMKYLERVIKETLRLFPAGPIIGRVLQKDVKVDENVVIPKDCDLMLTIFTLHRNDKYWKDPLTFNPDRFLPGNYDPKCFLPFSAGKRDCIGQTFAMFEMKAIVATILRKFVVQIDNPVIVKDIDLKYSLTLKPAKPILLRFYKR
ncbi:cytochrome P450 4C1-like isoform X2 [Polistes fuscatus]|uniref:cytochrome P450 4C1-like isoform X2 n=1 Tax=Polistes fuscatus TaxID=30207 RepID=UPI001CA98DA7|nr:cytochrome P450 4C1-like isoform X2 [Polistes fuscatus]